MKNTLLQYDTHLEKTNIDKERKQEPLFSAHENSLQNQYIDQVQNQKPAGPSVHSSTPSRRSGGRNEVCFRFSAHALVMRFLALLDDLSYLLEGQSIRKYLL